MKKEMKLKRAMLGQSSGQMEGECRVPGMEHPLEHPQQWGRENVTGSDPTQEPAPVRESPSLLLVIAQRT